MCRLVIRAPCSYCVPHVAATEFDLRIFAHLRTDCSRELVERVCDVVAAVKIG